MKTQLFAVADAHGNIYPFSFRAGSEEAKWCFTAKSSRFVGMEHIELPLLEDEWSKCEKRGDRVIFCDILPIGEVSTGTPPPPQD